MLGNGKVYGRPSQEVVAEGTHFPGGFEHSNLGAGPSSHLPNSKLKHNLKGPALETAC